MDERRLTRDRDLVWFLLYVLGGATWPALVVIGAVRLLRRVTGLRVRVVRERRRRR